MTILDIPFPDRAGTRPQVRQWADEVYAAFIDFLSEQEFWGHEMPTEDDPEGWEGDYKYESMSILDKVLLLVFNSDQRSQLLNHLVKIADIDISVNLATLFINIIVHLPDEGGRDHLSMDQVRTRILNILFDQYKNKIASLPKQDGNEVKYVPNVVKRDYKYFYELFYTIIDEVLEKTLESTPQQLGVLQDQRLYRAEKAGDADASQKRGQALNTISGELGRAFEQIVSDMQLGLPTTYFTTPMSNITFNRLYEMIPTLVTFATAARLKIDNNSIKYYENALSHAIHRAFRDKVMSISSSPSWKQIRKATAPYDQQTQVRPSDEPYEAPQS